MTQGIRIFTLPIETDDEAGTEHVRVSIQFFIIGSIEDIKTLDGRTVKGREYVLVLQKVFDSVDTARP